MACQIKASGLPAPVRELQFVMDRKWRFDFAWPGIFLAMEIEGGTHTNGRHVRAKGFESDCIKYNRAALEGWVVLRVTGDMVLDRRAIKLLVYALAKLEGA